MCSAVAQVLRPHVAFNQRLDTFCVPDTGDQGVRCDPVCGGRTGCRKGNRARGALPWLESNYTLSSLSSPDAVVLCFAGGANDSLGLCDCCWGFPGEVNVSEARFQGESSPDRDVSNEGDCECPLGKGSLLFCIGVPCQDRP